MFCQNCAKELEPNANICVACRTPVAHSQATPTEIADKAKAASQSALTAFKLFSINPVGGLSVAFENLEKRRARDAGIVFSVVFLVCVLIGTYMVLPAWGKPNFQGFLGLLILGAVPPSAIAGVSALARKAFNSGGSFESDVFIAGAALLPVGFVVFLTGILGMGNIEVTAILGVFAGCYAILMLYSGCARISRIPDTKAAVTVPVMLLVSAWLCKVVFAAML
jgi:hypothetical protein